jgi:DNA-binding GntR family transcriptional regulator
MKKTAVEWLVEQLERNHVKIDIKNTVAYEQAKAMEKRQIIDAWIGTDNELQRMAAERHYEENYMETKQSINGKRINNGNKENIQD